MADRDTKMLFLGGVSWAGCEINDVSGLFWRDPRLTSPAPFSVDIRGHAQHLSQYSFRCLISGRCGSFLLSVVSFPLRGSPTLSPWHFAMELFSCLCSPPPSSASAGQACFLGTFSSLHLLLIILLLSSNCLLRGKRVHVLVEYLHAYVRSLPRQPPSRQEAFLSMGNGGKLEKVQREGKTEHCWMNRKGSTFLVLKIKGRQLRGY